MEIDEEKKKAAQRYVAERLESRQLNSSNVKALLVENEQMKRSIEANLYALTESQLRGADSSIRRLQECRESLPKVQSRFTEINVMAGESSALLSEFPYELNQVRENLFQTRQLLREMSKVDERVEKVRKLMADEDNILEAHEELASLAQMRMQAIIDAKKVGDRYVMDGVDRYFRGVGEMEEKLDRKVKKHMDATFELARKRPSLLKQVLKIIELEEKADRSRPPEQLKSYHFAFREKLQQFLENRFNAVFANAIQTDITDALKIVEQGKDHLISPSTLNVICAIVYDNLPIIQQVNRYFPSKYMMYEFYAGNIHRNLRSCLSKLASHSTLKAADVVNLFFWANVTYVKKIESQGLVPKEWPITDTLKASIPTYAAYLRTLMQQWCARLLEKDRVSPSYVEIPRNIMTDSIVTLYKFVNQQIDLVSNTKDSFFIYEVSKEATKVIYHFQKEQKEMLLKNLKDLHMKYLLATLNNHAKAHEYTEKYDVKVRGLLSEPELSAFELEDRTGLLEGFNEVRKLAVACIVQQILELFRESGVLSKFFTKDWFNVPANEYAPMEIVVQTVSDALEQMVRKHLQDKYVSDVAKECLDKLLQRYVQELCLKSGYGSDIGRCIEEDKVLVENTFSALIENRAFISRRMNLMSSLINFLTTPMDDQGQFILTYNALLDEYPDLNPDVVKRIISARADCDRDALNDVIAACRGITPSTQKSFPFFSAISLKALKDKEKSVFTFKEGKEPNE